MSEIHNQREIELLEAQLRECRAENAKLLEEAEYELMYGYDMASADYRDTVFQQHREIAKLREANELLLTDVRRTDVDMREMLADNKRLRAAVEEIYKSSHQVHIIEIARAALGGENG